MHTRKISIGVFGACGRMGSAIVDLVVAEYKDQATISAKLSRGRGDTM